MHNKQKELTADFSSPAYIRMVDYLTEKIRSGSLQHGEILPPEKKLAEQLSCSRVTLRHALQILEQKGLIIKRRGRNGGNFISYRPDPANVKRKNIGLISNITSPATEPYFLHLLSGIQNELVDKAKLHLIAKESREFQDVMNDNTIDGMLLIGCGRSDEQIYEYLERTGMPHTIINSYFDFYTNRGFVSCDSDNFAGGLEAMKHLIELGHTQIGYIGCSNERSNQLDRYNAYKHALSENNIPFNSGLVHICENNAQNGFSYNTAIDMLQQTNKPTAIFVAGYYMTIEAIQAIKECNLRVPDDISIVGFDDFNISMHISPPLTTVRQPLEEIGRQSTQQLLEWITSGIVKNRQLTLPTELIIRGSTAPLKN